MISGSVRHHVSPIANQKMFRETISMCRGDAAITLLEKAKSLENVTVHFGCSLVNVNLDKRYIFLRVCCKEKIEGSDVGKYIPCRGLLLTFTFG